MAELVTDGDRRSIQTPSLRLSFRWTGDRWAHAIEVRRPGVPDPVAVVRTIEGDPDRDDPARVVSPAYQQLEFQEGGTGLRALLVGQSGPHHFSAVFAVEEGPDRVDIGVDVADRCRAPIEALACTYLVEATSGDLIDADPASIRWAIAPGRLTLDPTAPSHVQLSEGGRRATRAQAIAALAPGVQTHRCVYHWRWTPAPELRTLI